MPGGAAAMNFSSREIASGLLFWFKATVARWYCVSKFCGSSCSAFRNASLAIAASPAALREHAEGVLEPPALRVRGRPLLDDLDRFRPLARLGEQGRETDVAVHESGVELDRLLHLGLGPGRVALLLVERPEVVVHERDLGHLREDRFVRGDRPVGVAALGESDRAVDLARELAHVDGSRRRGRVGRSEAGAGRRRRRGRHGLRHELVLGRLLQRVDLLQARVEGDLAHAVLRQGDPVRPGVDPHVSEHAVLVGLRPVLLDDVALVVEQDFHVGHRVALGVDHLADRVDGPLRARGRRREENESDCGGDRCGDGALHRVPSQ